MISRIELCGNADMFGYYLFKGPITECSYYCIGRIQMFIDGSMVVHSKEVYEYPYECPQRTRYRPEFQYDF